MDQNVEPGHYLNTITCLKRLLNYVL